MSLGTCLSSIVGNFLTLSRPVVFEVVELRVPAVFRFFTIFVCRLNAFVIKALEFLKNNLLVLQIFKTNAK